ncbi:hypothetical protein ACWDV4_13860 [Micromonospora sp. NPDC003197]
MGYLVEPSGRLHLPQSDDAAAVAAAKAAMAEPPGWFAPDEPAASETLAEIAEAAAAFISRDGDWIEFGYDDAGDPKWSDQATAFYVAIAPFVRSGVVHIKGEDGSRWSYTYAHGQITQQGWNGWDASIEPFGEPVEPCHPAGRRRQRPRAAQSSAIWRMIIKWSRRK